MAIFKLNYFNHFYKSSNEMFKNLLNYMKSYNNDSVLILESFFPEFEIVK